ncbi:hypothetical protein AOQ84DRAFT_226498 [Glonium stellatum]|uniref:Uncharacterized protein n=1 Tax=Glonium stellatum TaxID=574774 RepID=A0A8E2FA25_9PEZI|nr:hypothetical protein AOQ84DRAFT_226498 [Glonium stellatum]
MDDNTNPGSQRLVLLMSMLPIIQHPPDAFPEQGIVHARRHDKARYGSCIEGYDSCQNPRSATLDSILLTVATAIIPLEGIALTEPASAWLRRGNTRRGKDPGELLCAAETTTCADRFLSNVAVTGDNLQDNGIIEASAEHPTDRIRNAGNYKRAPDDNDGELAGNLPSLEERTALRPKMKTEASKTGSPLQRLE